MTAKEVTDFFKDKGVTFNAEALKITKDSVEVDDIILDKTNWDKIKSTPGSDVTKPYKVTIIVGEDKSKKAFKLALYRDGSYAITDIQ